VRELLLKEQGEKRLIKLIPQAVPFSDSFLGCEANGVFHRVALEPFNFKQNMEEPCGVVSISGAGEIAWLPFYRGRSNFVPASVSEIS
jgi:hypothetical protein